MRTDGQLRQYVIDELHGEPSVCAGHIGVAVKHGVATLSGQVPWSYARWNAPGLQDVADRPRIH